MGNGFKKIKASFIGSHQHSDKIPQWLKANGGLFSRVIDESVTHLIATESAVKANADAVKKARSLNIKIVTYDWLEDSLLSKTRKPKQEGPYLWDRILGEQRNKSKVVKKPESKMMRLRKNIDSEEILGEFSKNARAIASDMKQLGYHLYVNQATGVSYSATFIRNSLVNNRARKETFYAGVSDLNICTVRLPPNHHLIRVPIHNPVAQLLQVYETNGLPHAYTTFVQYTRVGATSKDILAPKGTLDSALFVFKKIFHMKTGLEWEDRFDNAKLPSPKGSENGGNIASPSQGWFQFERPGGLMGALHFDVEKTRRAEADAGIMPEAGVAEDDAMPVVTDAPASVDDI